MRRIHDPARAMRERLLRLEQQERARAEAREVAEGVAETVALSRARGAAIAEPAAAQKRTRAQPYRRQTGLQWLALKGRLNRAQAAAGERYGGIYRRAKTQGSLPSTWTISPGGSGAGGGPTVAEVLAHGEASAQAAAALARLRQRLGGQSDLVQACDLVCGEELTPREAAGGEREAGRLEAVLKVALDLLG